MAEPPRLSEIRLPDEKSVIYFVTLCVKDRRQVLANAKVFEAVKSIMAELRKWRARAAVIMPDHIRCIISPIEERGFSAGDFANGFKRLLQKRLGTQTWEWQRECFDRLLRSHENLESKWIYVQENPVRKGLVKHWEQWPYYLDFVNKEGSYQLPLQEDGRTDGKLTASPTV
jgi:putative transposase